MNKKQKIKRNKQQMDARLNYNWLKSRILENVDLQNGYLQSLLKTQSSKYNTMFLRICHRRMTENFWKVCLYVAKIDFEVGPMWSKLVKNQYFCQKMNKFSLRPATELKFLLKSTLFLVY